VGYGNWLDASQRIHTKSKTECEHHYNKCYITEAHDALPKFRNFTMEVHSQPLVYKLCDDPPRYQDSSVAFQEMGGYMAARGDFNVEYDQFSELEILSLSFDETEEEVDELDEKLKLSMVEIYQNSVRERWRRKRLVRKFGLINITKNSVLNRRFEHTIKDFVDKLKVFMQLVDAQAYDEFLEGFHIEQELKNQIVRLQDYRQNGLTSLRGAKIYRILKKRRHDMKTRNNLLHEILIHVNDERACQTWLQRQAMLETISKGVPAILPCAPRRIAPPLDITGLPGYEKLSDAEREICASVRLVPEAYLEFKYLMMNECKKAGCLKLGQARALVKIDVNKTRRIYDFLYMQGFINKEPLT